MLPRKGRTMKKLTLFLVTCFLLVGITSAFAGYSDPDAVRLGSDGSVSEPSITWLNDQDTGFYRVGANQIGIIVGGVKVGEFDSTGLSDLLGIVISTSTSSKPDISYTNTNADALSGSTAYAKTSTSPTINDTIWTHTWSAQDSSGNAAIHYQIVVTQTDETNLNEDVSVVISTIKAGTLTETMSWISGVTTIQDLIIDDHFELDPGSTITSSALTDATITPVTARVILDTYTYAAVATVSRITTANVELGEIFVITSYVASQDTVFDETINIDLGATSRTLSDPLDVLMVMKVGADQWIEISFVDNN